MIGRPIVPSALAVTLREAARAIRRAVNVANLDVPDWAEDLELAVKAVAGVLDVLAVDLSGLTDHQRTFFRGLLARDRWHLDTLPPCDPARVLLGVEESLLRISRQLEAIERGATLREVIEL